MTVAFPTRPARRPLLAAALAAAMLAFAPLAPPLLAPAAAQISVSAEFRAALEPYGHWERHPRWGEVWVPEDVDPDWRPYQIGRWVYTEDWGWYWISDEDFGWIVYHYGRWVFDRDLGLGWVWMPGDEWGPAWVFWRHGSQVVGWAPLPPDDIAVEYWDEPNVWLFVRAGDFVAPRIRGVLLPPHDFYFRDTVVVNRTVVIRDRGPRIAVNPGIAPAYIAAAIGRPLRAYEVRPRIVAGTARIRGAEEVRGEDLRRRLRERPRVTVRETESLIRPAGRVPPPQPLATGAPGRLGSTPPRAARGVPEPGDTTAPARRPGEKPALPRDATQPPTAAPPPAAARPPAAMKGPSALPGRPVPPPATKGPAAPPPAAARPPAPSAPPPATKGPLAPPPAAARPSGPPAPPPATKGAPREQLPAARPPAPASVPPPAAARPSPPSLPPGAVRPAPPAGALPPAGARPTPPPGAGAKPTVPPAAARPQQQKRPGQPEDRR